MTSLTEGVGMADLYVKDVNGKTSRIDLDAIAAVLSDSATSRDTVRYVGATTALLGTIPEELPAEVAGAWNDFLDAYAHGREPEHGIAEFLGLTVVDAEEHEREVTRKVKRARKVGRQTISLRLDDGLLKALDAYAESRGCTRTEVIEESIQAHIGYGVQSHESALVTALNRLTIAVEGISR